MAAAVGNVAGGIVGVVTILILSFYLLVEADSLQGLVPAAVSAREPRARRGGQQRHHRQGERVARRTAAAGHDHRHHVGDRVVGARVPFFYVLALISGIGELIPVVGPILAAIPALAIAATVSLKKVLFVLIFFFLQQQFENHVLVPKVMSRQVGVSPVTVIVALLIGGKLLGIVGAILAVPTAAILQVVASELLGDGT